MDGDYDAVQGTGELECARFASLPSYFVLYSERLGQIKTSGEVWQFAVCRFNYTGGLDNPELSSTAPITELNFHRFEEYTDLVFGKN